MADKCIICGNLDVKLAQCRDISSWVTLYRAAVVRGHKQILEASTSENEFPCYKSFATKSCYKSSVRIIYTSTASVRGHKQILEASTSENEFPVYPIKYHRNCRAEFTNKRDLQVAIKLSDDPATESSTTRRRSRDGTQSSLVMLPDHCLFCKKSKYKPGTKTGEKLHSVQEFRADETVKASASLLIQQNTGASEVARDVIGIFAKDLISSEAKYHASCYKSFVRIIYTSTASDCQQESSETTCPLQPVYESVYHFCKDLIDNPEIIEYKVVKELFLNKASELKVTVPESHSKNLLRKLSNLFPEINFISHQYNKILMYQNTLSTDKAVLDFFELKSELQDLKGSIRCDEERSVIKLNTFRRKCLGRLGRMI